MAVIGLAGLASAFPSADSSADSNGPAQATGAKSGNTFCAGLRPVRGTEGVHYKDIGQCRQPF